VKVPLNDPQGEATVIECYSRGGLQFSSLQKIKDEIKNNLNEIMLHIPPQQFSVEGELRFVLDGEMCVIGKDGSEDYRSIVSEIKRKSATVQNPRYLVFDLLTHAEFKSGISERSFSERLAILQRFLPTSESNLSSKTDMDGTFKHMRLLSQLPFTEEMFSKMSAQSEKQGWEGLMLRKDTIYCGDRSNDILKVKRFETEEYVVEDVVIGDITVINEGTGLQEKIETMVSVIINHTGPNANTGQQDVNQINVGSGFSHQERQLYYEKPDLIKGKTISVQFFEKTSSRDGKESLRFPTFKGLHGEKRVL
jgi:DNA ligase-1